MQQGVQELLQFVNGMVHFQQGSEVAGSLLLHHKAGYETYLVSLLPSMCNS